MKKKIHLVDFGEEKTKNLAEIMSNKTSKKILDYLGKKEGTATEIAKKLDMALSTVHYNIEKLVKEDLIEVKRTFWSSKGNKVNIYQASNKILVFTQNKSKIFKNKLTAALSLAMVVILLFAINISFYDVDQVNELSRFSSGEELIQAFEKARENGRGFFDSRIFKSGGSITSAAGGVAVMESAAAPSASGDFSTTNIQVEGVDEADIIKTDGKYIYTLSDNKLIIAKAYPAEEAEIISKLDLGDFRPMELFIEEDRLLMFGSERYDFKDKVIDERFSYRSIGGLSVRLYDIEDKEEPELVKVADFEGTYLTSRKIEEEVYFVINAYPRFYGEDIVCGDIVPLYREGKEVSENLEDMIPIVDCTDIGYVEPIQAENFITIASISMIEDREIKKEIIVGSGQNVYASLENLYIVQTSYPGVIGGLIEDEETVITKFKLDKGDIEFVGSGEVKGHILNQFSMDEYDEHFRIATTSGRVWGGESNNNLYVLDEDLETVGSLEDLAPGEKIYSVRFMGKKGYIVTFKKVDPLFVIDLSDPSNPNVLGKLKIPGYSDYLHPYDENHIIGIGKDTVEAEEGLKDSRRLDFAWYQGVKMAVFDVSDVNNPIEMHKVIIGDRGTDSPALHNHRAFLFDREKNLLVLPITLAEIKGEKSSDNQYGEFTFQGAYVYDLTLEDGFDLKGRITHYESDEVFKKSGFYFRGDSAVERSLYIGDVLYTLSRNKLKLNSLKDLEELKDLVF